MATAANLLPAGRLRHRIRIEALSTDIDSDGAQVESWADPFGLLLSAEIVPLSGRELLAAQGEHGQVSGYIRLRWRAGIDAGMRAVHRGTVYDIQAVLPDPESGVRWLRLVVAAGVSSG